MRFIECTAVSDSGSGESFPASVRVDQIALILDVPEGILKGVRATVRIPGLEEALLTAETREELMQRIIEARDTTC
jgi:hypothetical protein